jgi:cytochrome c oxidase subunit IV
MNHERNIRVAALFVLAGLLVQLFSTLFWSPLTFVVFAMVGAPLVLLGVFLYVATLWRILKERKAL